MGLEDAPGSNLPRGSRHALLLAKVGSPHLTDSAPYWDRPDEQWSAPLSADNTVNQHRKSKHLRSSHCFGWTG